MRDIFTISVIDFTAIIVNNKVSRMTKRMIADI